MRYLWLVILISMFGFGLNTTVFAQVCCPDGSVQDGRRCVITGTQTTRPTVPCRPGRPPGSSGGGPGSQSTVSSPWVPSHCPPSFPPGASREAATNQCVAALSGGAQFFWFCFLEDDAGRAEDYRTGLSCPDRLKALANQCRDRCARFAATKTDCNDTNDWWQRFFGDIGGSTFGFARVNLCGPRLPTYDRGFETRPPGFHVPAPNRPFDTRPPWFR